MTKAVLVGTKYLTVFDCFTSIRVFKSISLFLLRTYLYYFVLLILAFAHDFYSTTNRMVFFFQFNL